MPFYRTLRIINIHFGILKYVECHSSHR